MFYMKQILQNLRNGKTEVVEVPQPQLKPGFALVKNAASLVSAGTERMLVSFAEKSLLEKARSRPDLVRQVMQKAQREGLLTTMEAAFNRLDQPMVLGYSSAGTIVGLGEGLTDLRVNQRVACAGGNYAVHAEYVLVPKNLLTPLPDEVDFESAAFVTLGAIAMHGFRLSKAALGENVAVIGLGLVGLLAAGIASAAGCQVLGIDINEQRLPLALQMGAQQAVLRGEAEEAARVLSRGRGMDAVLICADSTTADPVELAGAIARDRAIVVASGAVKLSLPRKVYYEKELFFVNSRSYGPGRYDSAYEEKGMDYPIGYVRWSEGRNLEAVVALLAQGKLRVKPLISHRYDISQAEEAYALISGKKNEPYLGILITYPASPIERKEPLALSVEQKAMPTVAHSTVERVRLGVLGAGNFANAVMLPAIAKVGSIERVSICSANGVNAQAAAKRFNFSTVAAEEKELISSVAINTVAILTRHHLHASQTLAALQHGKHVFCEKPLALTYAELESLENWLTSHPDSPLLMVGFNRRFSPLMKTLVEFFTGRQEPLIAHYRVNAGYIPLQHWVHDPQVGGGRLRGEVCHFIDALTFLCGSLPLHVSVQSLPDKGIYQQDNLVITLRFADESLGTITYTANGDKSFSKERLEVFCCGRVGVLDDFRSLVLTRNGHRRQIHSWLRQDKGHQAEWEAFAKALTHEGKPPIPYEQIFAVHRATLACADALCHSSS